MPKLTYMTKITKNNLDTIDLSGRLVAYGEDSDGYIARAHSDPVEQYTINGLGIEFIFENYDWLYVISEI